jgi:hypothetical protein
VIEFQIRTKNGLKPVQGYIHGHIFGMHLAVDGKWNITHLPTGYAAARAPNYTTAKEFVSLICTFREWDTFTWDEPDPNSKIIIDIPGRLTKRMQFAAMKHGVELTSGSIVD